jgi:hypothetical protein
MLEGKHVLGHTSLKFGVCSPRFRVVGLSSSSFKFRPLHEIASSSSTTTPKTPLRTCASHRTVASLTGVFVTQTLVPLQRIVPGERSAAVANDCLAIMPGSRLQVSHSVTFPMKSLVTPSDPTLPQLHVDLLYSLPLPAFSLAAAVPATAAAAASASAVDWFRVRTTSHLRYASG